MFTSLTLPTSESNPFSDVHSRCQSSMINWKVFFARRSLSRSFLAKRIASRPEASSESLYMMLELMVHACCGIHCTLHSCRWHVVMRIHESTYVLATTLRSGWKNSNSNSNTCAINRHHGSRGASTHKHARTNDADATERYPNQGNLFCNCRLFNEK